MNKVFAAILVAVLVLTHISPASADSGNEFRPSCKFGDLFAAAVPNHMPSVFVNHEGDLEVNGSVVVCSPGYGYSDMIYPTRPSAKAYQKLMLLDSGYTIRIYRYGDQEALTGFVGDEVAIGSATAGIKIVLPGEIKDKLLQRKLTDPEYYRLSVLLLLIRTPKG